MIGYKYVEYIEGDKENILDFPSGWYLTIKDLIYIDKYVAELEHISFEKYNEILKSCHAVLVQSEMIKNLSFHYFKKEEHILAATTALNLLTKNNQQTL